MKLYNTDTFNYPVIKEIKDDYRTTFNFIVDESSIQNTKTEVVLHYTLKTDSTLLKNAYVNRKVGIYAHIYASTFMYREIVSLDYPKGEIKLPRDRVFKALDITPIIVAKEDFEASIEEEAKEEEEKFQVEKNTILGFNETLTLDLDYKMSHLDDLVVVTGTPYEDMANKIDLNDDKVIYYMSKKEHLAFKNLYLMDSVKAKLYTKNVHLALYTRMLIEILDYRSSSTEEEILDYAWYNMVAEKLKSKSLDIKRLKIDNYTQYAFELAEINYDDLYNGMED